MQKALLIAGCLVGWTISGCCTSHHDAEKLPASIPIYPAATLAMSDTTIAITNYTYHSQDDGKKIRAWYASHAGASWTNSCGPKWNRRREMLGMHFDYRCYKSRGKDGYFRVEVGDNPSKPPRVIRIRHCPPSRPDRCSHKP